MLIVVSRICVVPQGSVYHDLEIVDRAVALALRADSMIGICIRVAHLVPLGAVSLQVNRPLHSDEALPALPAAYLEPAQIGHRLWEIFTYGNAPSACMISAASMSKHGILVHHWNVPAVDEAAVAADFSAGPLPRKEGCVVVGALGT